MLVYRICKEKEISQIFNHYNFNEIGQYYKKTDINNHNYDENELYLHFFIKKDSIFYFNTTNGMYICTYDIPEDILEKYEGIGYYYDYINYRYICNVTEYAVKSREINFDFLERVELIKETIDIEDFLEEYELNGFLKIIYEKSTPKRLIK